VYARVATFQGDPANVDEMVSQVRGEVESDQAPAGLEGAKMLMLVDRESGKTIGITLFDSEDAMRRGDEALNAMTPDGGVSRSGVEFYEVPVSRLS
jgi:exopolysaccharide biosynthesis protein